MTRFILKRLVETIFVLFLALTAVFGMVRLSGDPVLLMVPADATAEFIEQFRKDMGFDRPLLVQYGAFIFGAIQGDFGRSLRQQAGAISLVFDRVPASLLLTVAAIIPTILLSIPIGILSPHSWAPLKAIILLSGSYPGSSLIL